MIILKKLKIHILSILFFLCYPLHLYPQNLSNISLEELEAFEQELAKLTPEEWDALNKEINNTINNMSEEDRQKLFAEAALEAERLESEFKTLRDAGNTKPRESLAQKSEDSIINKKTNEVAVKPKVNQSEQIKNLEVLNNLSTNLDQLQLIVTSSPLLKVELDCNPLWSSFLKDYYLLHSMVNSIINNLNLQENLLLSEWDNLRADLAKWNKALNLIREIQFSDNDESISRSEAQVILSFINNLLSNNSSETLTWSLKRMMQKYAEEEFKKIEKNSKENKQVYRPASSSKKDITSVKLGFPQQQKGAIKNLQPNPGSSGSSRAPIGDFKNKKNLTEEQKPESTDDSKKSSVNKSSGSQGQQAAGEDLIKQKDQDEKKEKTQLAKDKKNEKKEKSFVLKPEKRLINKLNNITEDVNTLFVDITKDVLPKDLMGQATILRSNFLNRLLLLSFELAQIQLDLMEFYDADVKPSPKIAKDLGALLENDKSFIKTSLKFAGLKSNFDPLNQVSSFDIISAINKNKIFKIEEKLKDLPEDLQNNYNSLMMQESIKPSSNVKVDPNEVISNSLHLIYDIADRLMTIASLSDNVEVKTEALTKLKKLRIAD
jgi:hypothetical protein